MRIGRWASSNSVEQIQYYGKASKVRRSLLSCARGKASSETNTELKSLDLRSPHKDTERRQRETVSGRAKMPRTTLVGSGVVGVIGWREGKTSGSEHWHMCPQVAERINDLLSTEGLSPVKCRSLSLSRAPSLSLSLCGRDLDETHVAHLQGQVFDRALQHCSACLLWVPPRPVSQMALSCFAASGD